MPLRLLRVRNFAAANVAGALGTAGGVAWFVIGTLYLQRVLVTIRSVRDWRLHRQRQSWRCSHWVFPPRFSRGSDIREPLWIGFLLSTAGLALFARAPLDGTFIADILPAMLLLGIGGAWHRPLCY